MQILVNGLISGLILAVLALGFTAVYLPLKIFYLALGAVYTIVPFLVWGMMQAGWPWYLASVVAILLTETLCERGRDWDFPDL
jgi:branched-subunit amino acid ABC-type transport system permease component